MNRSACLLEGAPNFRDLGGYAARDGRTVRQGRVFRSEVLIGLTGRDLATLAACDIGLVCDLRSPQERERHPVDWPDGQELRTLAPDAVRELSVVQPDEWRRRLMQPGFGEEQARRALTESYRRMPAVYGPGLREVLHNLAAPSERSVLIHCTAGKDRTGFVCAMLLWALDVPRETIFTDYLLTNERYSAAQLMRVREKFLPGLVPTPQVLEALRALSRAHSEYLLAALAQIETDFGGCDAYLEKVCGLDADLQRRLHAALLES